MLNIIYGDYEGVVTRPEIYFKNTYEDDWITDELSRRMIQDVDRSTVINAHVIESPVLGAITPRELSGGVKTLILIHKVPDMIFYASACGDNCAKWLLEIGKYRDVTINLRHLMDFGDGYFDIHIQNTDQVVHTMKELVPIAGLIVG